HPSGAASVTSIWPATQPTNAPPIVMMTGKRSISFSSSVAPKMTSGIEMARPRISRRMLPPAAAATAMTLSRLITRSAIRMVLIADNSWVLASISASSSSGTSSFTPIQNSSTLPRPDTRASFILEQAHNLAVDQVDLVRRRHLGQTRHGHDVAADHHHELGAGGESYLADVDRVSGGRGAQLRIGRERVLGLRH